MTKTFDHRSRFIFAILISLELDRRLVAYPEEDDPPMPSPAANLPIPRRFHYSAEIRTSVPSFKQEELRKRPAIIRSSIRGLSESDSLSAKYLLAAASSQQWLSAWLPWAGRLGGGCNRRIENGMENANVLLSCVPQSSPKRPALILNAAVARSSALLATFTN